MNDREQLNGEIGRNETRAHWGALAVVAGLVIEAVLAIAFPNGTTALENWTPIVADSLVALGVYAEIHFSGKAARAHKRLQEIIDQSLTEALRQAAAATAKATELQVALEEERKKRLGRSLTKEQFDILQTLRGKVKKVYVTCDRDPEALYFSGQISTALTHAGIEVIARPPKSGHVGTGVLILLGSTWPGSATKHPLVDAFFRAGLLAGTWQGSPDFPSDAPIILIGQKMVELGNAYFPPTN
jgi:hypothetical protein